MISKISGKLENLKDGKATIQVQSFMSYDVLLPSFVAGRLGGSLDQQVTLFTIYHLEGNAQGSSFTPRLFGFLHEEDRAFFELFTTVKGIGPRKALKALAMDSRQIAMAIAERDIKMLQSLPEIGKRTAETITVTLNDKVDRFLQGPVETAAASPLTSSTGALANSSDPSRQAARDALEILTQLGENPAEAMQWIDKIMQASPELDDAQHIINQIFIKRGG